MAWEFHVLVVANLTATSDELLAALREGDYSIRGTGAKPGSAADLVLGATAGARAGRLRRFRHSGRGPARAAASGG